VCVCVCVCTIFFCFWVSLLYLYLLSWTMKMSDQWYILIGKHWYQLPEFIPSSLNPGPPQLHQHLHPHSAGHLSSKTYPVVYEIWPEIDPVKVRVGELSHVWQLRAWTVVLLERPLTNIETFVNECCMPASRLLHSPNDVPNVFKCTDSFCHYHSSITKYCWVYMLCVLLS